MIISVKSVHFADELAEETKQKHQQEQEIKPKRLRLKSFIDQYGTIRPEKPNSERVTDCLKKFWSTIDCMCVTNTLLDRIPIIRCLKEYNFRGNILGDLMAGIIVAIMHIPQGMAYGILTTLPPVYGLYVSFFPVLLYMIFGTCRHLSIGTFAIISLMTAKAIDGTPLTSSPMTNDQSNGTSNTFEEMIILEKVGIATTLAFFVGIVQLILSILRLGFLTVYMTEPFVSGFTSGAAVHVISTQIPSIFGVSSPSNLETAFKLPRFYVKLIGSIIKNINWVSTGIGLTSTILLFIAKYLNDRYKSTVRIVIPNELILVIIGTIISHFAKIHDYHGVSVVGNIKKGLPPPALPPFKHISYIIVPSITIAMVSLCIAISMGKVFSRKHNYKVSSNQELLAYGMSNIVPAFFQCYPSAASLSRSVVQEGSGSKTQLVGAFSCIVLAVVLLVLAPLFKALPMACLAAIIIVNLKGLIFQIKDVVFYYRISFIEFILWIVTFVAVVLFEVDIGLYVGLGTSFFLNTVRTQKPHFSVLGQVGDTELYKDIKRFQVAHENTSIRILRFNESLYACNAPFFKRKLYELIGIQLRQEPLITWKKQDTDNNEDSEYKYIVLDCSPFNFIDTVGVKLLIEVYNDLKRRGIRFYLSECRYGVRRSLELMDFYAKTGPGTIFVTTHLAVTAMKHNSAHDLETSDIGIRV